MNTIELTQEDIRRLFPDPTKPRIPGMRCDELDMFIKRMKRR